MRAWAELRQRSGNHLVTSSPLARKRSQWRFGPGGRRDDGDGLPAAKGTLMRLETLVFVLVYLQQGVTVRVDFDGLFLPPINSVDTLFPPYLERPENFLPSLIGEVSGTTEMIETFRPDQMSKDRTSRDQP
ncbi:hypothetical protein ROHU_029593 [Labeo rohita]|uniref:Uncharacterized protein n=1 Tax=Labeo rohita TaxID=84645 RepID=A0A498LVZ8_LABRO|nr:hypothetical protein ROHU_029593 [Labeo rohita]